MAIEKGDKVTFEYVGSLEDGTVFDASDKHGKPVEVEIGSGMIIPGLDNAIIGMDKDEEKELTIPSVQAYGDHKADMLKKVPKNQLPEGQDPQPGMMLMMGLPDGQQIPAKIVEVTDQEITIDVNHPLAGKTLNFKIKIVEVKKA